MPSSNTVARIANCWPCCNCSAPVVKSYFALKWKKDPKIAELEVTMPDGKSKTQEIFNDTVIGYNKLGEEVVRITVEEPTFERPAEEHVNSDLKNHMNTTTRNIQTEPVDAALSMARQALYRFAAISFLDPRAGSWEQLRQFATEPLLQEAAEFVRLEPRAAAIAIGTGRVAVGFSTARDGLRSIAQLRTGTERTV